MPEYLLCPACGWSGRAAEAGDGNACPVCGTAIAAGAPDHEV